MTDTDKLAEIRAREQQGSDTLYLDRIDLVAAFYDRTELLRIIDELQSAPPRIPEGHWLAPWQPDISMMSASMDVHNRDDRTAIGRGRITDIYAANRDAYLAAHPECAPGESGASALLGAKHTGTRISATGVLGRIRDGRYYAGLNYCCGVMLEHLEKMASRFYGGDAKAVDEFLQLYCLDDARPSPPVTPEA